MSQQNTQQQPIVNAGPSREIWDEALLRSGLDPQKITAYNISDEGQSVSPKKVDSHNHFFQRIKLEGYRARVKGIPRGNNWYTPVRPGTSDEIAWFQGWDLAEKDFSQAARTDNDGRIAADMPRLEQLLAAVPEAAYEGFGWVREMCEAARQVLAQQK